MAVNVRVENFSITETQQRDYEIIKKRQLS